VALRYVIGQESVSISLCRFICATATRTWPILFATYFLKSLAHSRMKICRLKVVLTMVLILCATSAWTQTSLIKGRVIDKRTGETLPGVNISVPERIKAR